MATDKFNRICIVCGKQYKYCPDCGDYSDQPTWRDTYDTDNCHKIFQIMTDYLSFDIYDKPSAKRRIQELDTSVITNEKLKREVNELLNDDQEQSNDDVEAMAEKQWHIAESTVNTEEQSENNTDNEIKDDYVKDTNNSKFFDLSKKNSYKGKKH